MNPAEFSTLAESERRLWWFRGMQRILFALLDPLFAGKARALRVMEAGSGTGFMAGVLHKRYGWKMFPLELAWEGASRTQVDGGIAPVQGDVTACPFPDGVFDAVISLDVLVHFAVGDEAPAMSELARVLRPGGFLVVRVSALDVLKSRHSTFTHERQRFTRARLIRGVEAQGLKVLRSTYANSLLLPVALARFRIWEPLLRLPPSSGTAPVSKWLDRLLYLPLSLESRWISWGFNFVAGQSLIVIAAKPR